MSKSGFDYAFPNGERVQRGMTLRDYFAATIANGAIAKGWHVNTDGALLGKFAYEMADAMLAERNK